MEDKFIKLYKLFSVNPRKKKSFKSKVKKEVEGVFRVIDEEGGEKMVLKSETDTSKPLTAE